MLHINNWDVRGSINKVASSYFICLFVAVDMIEEVDVVLKRQHGKHKHGDVKLFVFGDSYVDTGNWPKSTSSSWKEPYGFTYPGFPSGRFSDGLVLTDFIGMYNFFFHSKSLCS